MKYVKYYNLKGYGYFFNGFESPYLQYHGNAADAMIFLVKSRACGISVVKIITCTSINLTI